MKNNTSILSSSNNQTQLRTSVVLDYNDSMYKSYESELLFGFENNCQEYDVKDTLPEIYISKENLHWVYTNKDSNQYIAGGKLPYSPEFERTAEVIRLHTKGEIERLIAFLSDKIKYFENGI